MSKYKVGDKVLIEAEIKENAGAGAYKIDTLLGFRNLWINEIDIQGKTKTYEDGLNDAWELAKKVALTTDMVKTANIFLRGNICGIGQERLFEGVFALTPQEALAKIEAYEKSQQIQVGDVVYADDEPDSFGVVTHMDSERLYIMWNDGSSNKETDWSDIHKTGRTVDIEHLLEQIRGNE